jgi:ParB-like chromosome segregation protein Spo0J
MDNFPAYKTISTADLIPYARNSRTHSDAQVAKLAASIREFGFLNPIIVDGQKGIIAGHGRVMAAQKLGMDKLPCIEADHLTDAQRRAYVIADNRMALDAGWDDDLLKVELKDLDAVGFDLTLTGFDLTEINSLFDVDDSNEDLPEQQDLNATFEVAVECEDETQQETVFNLLTKEGYKCRILTM